MFGSKPHAYKRPVNPPSPEIFSVSLPGGTVWSWQQRDAAGNILAHSETLLPDYVACLCDALRRS